MNIEAIKKNVRAGHRVAVQDKESGEWRVLLQYNDDDFYTTWAEDTINGSWESDHVGIFMWCEQLEAFFHNPQIVPYEDLEVEVGDEVVIGGDAVYGNAVGTVLGMSSAVVSVGFPGVHNAISIERSEIHINMEDKRLDLSDEQLITEIRNRGLVKDVEAIK